MMWDPRRPYSPSSHFPPQQIPPQQFQIKVAPQFTTNPTSSSSNDVINNSQYVIQPRSVMRAYPSMSMTLTQLNALPQSSSTPPTNTISTPLVGATTQQQTQYLPVVAMDTVLSPQRDQRRVSVTTDSAASGDEDVRSSCEDTKPVVLSTVRYVNVSTYNILL